MAIEYRLTLAGETPAEVVAARALPEPADRAAPYPDDPRLLTADLFESRGFGVTVRAGRHGYVDATTDDGSWEWEPEAYVAVGFRMDKFADPFWRVTNMVSIVKRVLESGDEDAAFSFNGDVLYLTRFGGVLRKHHRETFWNHYPGINALIPG